MTDLPFFEALSERLRQRQVPGEIDWSHSAFRWMKAIAPASVGSVGVEMVKAWAEAGQRRVEDGARGCDLVIDRRRVEVRTSLQWRDGGLSFAQMRDESYDVVAMLGIEPCRVRIWVVPKSVCLAQPTQHGRETHWVRFAADDEPGWLAGYLVLDTDGGHSGQLDLFAA